MPRLPCAFRKSNGPSNSRTQIAVSAAAEATNPTTTERRSRPRGAPNTANAGHTFTIAPSAAMPPPSHGRRCRLISASTANIVTMMS